MISHFKYNKVLADFVSGNNKVLQKERPKPISDSGLSRNEQS